MSKPEDKQSAWSIFEAWGGMSWFPPVKDEDDKERGNVGVSEVQRTNNLHGERKCK
jgi:hypothetical protein